jgi:hypothetical protein
MTLNTEYWKQGHRTEKFGALAYNIKREQQKGPGEYITEVGGKQEGDCLEDRQDIKQETEHRISVNSYKEMYCKLYSTPRML